MPVLEADFLKGIIDPHDQLHQAALIALKKIREQNWVVSSSAFIELDMVLKQSAISLSERLEVFEALKNEIRPDQVVSITPALMSQAIQLQNKYHNIRDFYFDSIHLATAILQDGIIISSDRAFAQVKEVKQIPLTKVKQ